MKRNLTFLMLVLIFHNVSAQFSFIQQTNIPFKNGSKSLFNAWMGGINSGQYSKMKLDGDNIEDLVVFDRTSNKIKTFLAAKNSTNQYFWKYEPKFEVLFPNDLQNWVLLVDYDKDGRKDLFTFTIGGIRVFKNIASETGFEWQLASSQLKTEGFSGYINLYVQSTDLPAIVDADDDGDIDVLVFDFSGNTLEFHQNLAVERKLTEPFAFRKVATCWGNFIKEHCNDFILNQNCPTQPASDPSNARIAHSGNSAWIGDLDGDGLKDLLFGHIACSNTAVLYNKGGNGLAAKITSFSKDFPPVNPINFSVFPTVFYEDLDFDNIPDFVASPSVYNNEGQLIDFSNSVWFYKNKGATNAPKLEYQQANFLQADMIDLGENAAPALADLDGDGDLDLLIGYAGIRGTKGYRSGFQYYKNTGSKSQPNFELETKDFLKISDSLQITNTKPFFADVDNNGTVDFGFWANSLNGMLIRYLPNQNPKEMPFSLDFKRMISIPNPPNFSAGENLLFYDINQDGKVDLLVGKGSGNIEYYQNLSGGKNPDFKLVSSTFGGQDINFNTRSVSFAVADFDNRGAAQLLTSDYYGATKIYPNFKTSNGLLKADSSLIYNEFTTKNQFRSLGNNLISTAGDLDNDGLPDLIIGTNTGGLLFLKNQSVKKTPPIDNTSSLKIYPNPTSDFVYVKAPSKGSILLYSLTGQLLKAADIDGIELSIDLTNYPSGIYIIKWIGQNGAGLSQKLVVVK